MLIVVLIIAVSIIGSYSLRSPHKVYADACQAPATNFGTDNLTATVPTPDNYTVWLKMQIPSSTSNSILLSLNSTCYTVTAQVSTPLDTWVWVNYSNGDPSDVMSQSLTAGSQTLALIGIDTGVEADSILLLADNTCVPTGDGTNCATSQTNPEPSVTINSPVANGEIFGSSATIDSTATPNNGGSIVNASLSVNSSVIDTSTTSPYNFSLNTLGYTDGPINLTVSTTDNESNTDTDSVQVYISNGDLDGDGTINIGDLAIMAANWGSANASYGQGNITGASGSDTVSIADLAILAANWGWVKWHFLRELGQGLLNYQAK